jgi:transcriptional regulator with PAS, ATPase and Fis domain
MRALEMVRRLSQTTGSALITGESGTGKELFARAIHYNGPTAEGKFVAINCAALPETLVESELFGYCRGAFTGASQDKPGLFAQARGGTLLLDEVCAMPLHTQAKLLRFLETKEWTPVGGSRAVGLNARVLCAADSDIARDVQEGRFRKDLYYLNLIEIRLPPLRERREDIPALAEHFVAAFSREFQKPCPGISPGAIGAMMEYPWPGNVRELRNVIGRALILGDGGVIQPKDLSFVTPQAAESPADGDNLRSAVRSYQRMHILRVLRESGFDKIAAARTMGIGLSSLYRKMEELGISDAAAPPPGPGAAAPGAEVRVLAGIAGG